MNKKTLIILIIVSLVLGAIGVGGYLNWKNAATEEETNQDETANTTQAKPIEEKVPESYRKDFSEGEICGYIRKLKNIEKSYTCSDPQKVTPTEGTYRGKEIWDVLYSKEDSDDPKDTFSYIVEVSSGNVLEGPIYAEADDSSEPLPED